MKQYNVNMRQYPAKPRNKRWRDTAGGTSGERDILIQQGGSPQLWELVTALENGTPLKEEQYYLRPRSAKHVKATGDVVAYSTGNGDIVLPIASDMALGAIKVATGGPLKVGKDGTLTIDESLLGNKGKIYYAGKGLELLSVNGETNNQFNVKFGVAKGTALEGDVLYAATWWGQKLNKENVVTGAMSGVTNINGLLHLNASSLDIAKDKSGGWVRIEGDKINGLSGVNGVAGVLYLNHNGAGRNVRKRLRGSTLN